MGCISDIGVPFALEDLQKPNPQQIQKVFEWFAELLMNATRETVEPAMRAAAEDVCGEHMEVVPADTRNLMGFYISLRRLLLEVRLSISMVRTIAPVDLLCIVRDQRLFFLRSSEAYARSSGQDILLHYQLCSFPRVADCHNRRAL